MERMTFETWLFSSKRAWQDLSIRIVALGTVAVLLMVNSWFIVHIIELREISNGMLVVHDNAYFGIDAVKPWPWTLLLPVLWITVTGVDLVWAFGVYRQDSYQSWTLFFIAMAWSIPWSMFLWHLIRINS